MFLIIRRELNTMSEELLHEETQNEGTATYGRRNKTFSSNALSKNTGYLQKTMKKKQEKTEK